ncbi:MAG TPA: nucleotidyl transferase AbiEii/AbiGii toxin family protein [Acidobacteriota bacterium]
MDAATFWKTVVMDRTGFLDRLIALLNQHAIRFCVVGGQAVNAYAEPVVSLDLDLAVAVEQMGKLRSILEKEFQLKSFEHSLNVSAPQSDLRVQIQTDPRYGGFVDRAEERTIVGLRLPVARIEDVLQGKIWAVQDRARRSSKRQKDLADISRLLEASPDLRKLIPEEILSRLF